MKTTLYNVSKKIAEVAAKARVRLPKGKIDKVINNPASTVSEKMQGLKNITDDVTKRASKKLEIGDLSLGTITSAVAAKTAAAIIMGLAPTRYEGINVKPTGIAARQIQNVMGEGFLDDLNKQSNPIRSYNKKPGQQTLVDDIQKVAIGLNSYGDKKFKDTRKSFKALKERRETQSAAVKDQLGQVFSTLFSGAENALHEEAADMDTRAEIFKSLPADVKATENLQDALTELRSEPPQSILNRMYTFRRDADTHGKAALKNALNSFMQGTRGADKAAKQKEFFKHIEKIIEFDAPLHEVYNGDDADKIGERPELKQAIYEAYKEDTNDLFQQLTEKVGAGEGTESIDGDDTNIDWAINAGRGDIGDGADIAKRHIDAILEKSNDDTIPEEKQMAYKKLAAVKIAQKMKLKQNSTT